MITTLDGLANKIYEESYNCSCFEEKSIAIEDIVPVLADFLSHLFVPFDKERFIKKCKGE